MNLSKYKNPFIEERADPYIIKSENGYYYFTASYPMKQENDSNGYDRVVLRRSETLEGLAQAGEKTIWKSSQDSLSHRFIWAHVVTVMKTLCTTRAATQGFAPYYGVKRKLRF